jgi:hypothetical protein
LSENNGKRLHINRSEYKIDLKFFNTDVGRIVALPLDHLSVTLCTLQILNVNVNNFLRDGLAMALYMNGDMVEISKSHDRIRRSEQEHRAAMRGNGSKGRKV